ncbi:uncharacterized protein B0I36DRAFT_369387 [Microdochium trichocladiopsis]|uniref:MARVEL domain-containing protein n=1 Tax=Microdochium trichocladiopsis TaxID=1682393 RepID=A0A9P9BIK0_9PEZI|nr:uncharacterized protein B0I36DRAFT_369387 [Microdochium trichocladiopsis]KAH7014430.1 hypothetical protein B0I36DRAFT_369387 [Microdochium trichocladiopsis]
MNNTPNAMPMPQAEALRPAPRKAGQEHVLTYPPGFVAVRAIQLVSAIVVLGTAGYILGEKPWRGTPPPGFGLSLFAALSTIICVVYYIVAQYGLPAAYKYWAILAHDIFLLVLWLISYPLVGVAMADLGSHNLSSYDESIFSAGCAAAGFGAICFILFCVSLGIHGAALHRHRAAGGHWKTPASPAAPVHQQAGGYPAPNQAVAAGNFQSKQQGQFATTIQMQEQMPPMHYQQMPANMPTQYQQIPPANMHV